MADKHLMGWAGPDEAIRAWQSEDVRSHFQQYPRGQVREYKRFCYFDRCSTIATGSKWLRHYAQGTGDCVGFGLKNALEPLSCVAIARGAKQRFSYIFVPYHYAHGRNSPEGGNGRLGSGAGSLGSWQIASAFVHGILFFSDDGGLDYTGRVSDSWGNPRSKEWLKWRPTAVDNLLLTAARVHDADEARDAICNGAMLTIASSRGFSQRLQDRHGKSWFRGSSVEHHQKAYVGYAPAGDTGPHPEALLDQGSWSATYHGPQIDGPIGSGWVELELVDEILHMRGTECYAISAWAGLPANELDLQTF